MTWAVRGARLLTAVAEPVVEVGPGHCEAEVDGVIDDGGGGCGPLAALAATVTSGVLPDGRPALVLAVDMPRVSVPLLSLLAGHHAAASVVPVDRAGRWQPLCARWSADGLREAAALVERGERSMRALLAAVAVTPLLPEDWEPIGGADALIDVDTPADVEALA